MIPFDEQTRGNFRHCSRAVVKVHHSNVRKFRLDHLCPIYVYYTSNAGSPQIQWLRESFNPLYIKPVVIPCSFTRAMISNALHVLPLVYHSAAWR